jgi:DNA-binding MarR family transcriptional regulator
MLERDPIREAYRQWVDHGWEEAAAGMAMVTSLTRVHQILMERIDESLRPYDLTFARFEVLRLLAFTRAGSLRMSRLGSLLQVHPTSVTSAVQRLEGQGFVTRSRDDLDKRVVRAEITDSGRRVIEPATVAVNAVFADPGMAPADIVKLVDLLGSIRAGAGDLVW